MSLRFRIDHAQYLTLFRYILLYATKVFELDYRADEGVEKQ